MGLIREFKEYRNFYKKENVAKRELVFYSGNKFYTQHFEPIIQIILENTDIKVDFIASDPEDPIISLASDQFSFYVCNNLLLPMIAKLKAKALVMTMPDLGTYHIKRALDPNVNHMYIFHAPASTTMMYRKGAFDNYDTIFCPGPQHKKEIQKTEEVYNLKSKTLVEAGYYLLEKRFNEYKTNNNYEKQIEDQVLIAPSWHDENLMQVCGKELVKSLLNNEYKVVFRPHPQTIITRERKKKTESIIEPFLTNNNFTYEVNPLEDSSFYLSSILITDWSSISFEYAWGTERPVVFIDTPRKVFNPEYKKIGIPPIEVALRSEIGLIVPPSEVGALPQKIRKIKNNQDNYKESIRKTREDYIYNFGRSTEVIAEYLIDYCQSNK
jgi:YidC/Oxa1 family membrane protein insertase